MTNSPFQIVHALKSEFEHHTPNVWPDIKAKLATQVAEQLLKELSGLPSPEGRLFFEMHSQKTRLGA
jgi:hypothetical protein